MPGREDHLHDASAHVELLLIAQNMSAGPRTNRVRLCAHSYWQRPAKALGCEGIARIGIELSAHVLACVRQVAIPDILELSISADVIEVRVGIDDRDRK